MKRIFLFLMMFCFLCSVFGDSAAPSSSPGMDLKPSAYIGKNLDEIFASLGVPGEVFTVRGAEAWQDDVVFYYPESLYIFWFKNRVWQFRLDRRYKGEAAGIPIGLGREEVRLKFGRPYYSDELSDIFINPGEISSSDLGYRIKVRLFYDPENKVSDIYIYRGDF